MANAVCGTVPGKRRRDIVRIKIKYHKYLRDCKQFAIAHTDGRRHKIKIDVGARSHNLILLVDNLCAFKFPLHDSGYAKSTREKRIVDAFSKISPIKIPKLDIIQWGDITVRKYEFADGVPLKKISPKKVLANRDKIARQIAKFIFDINISDPSDIRDLKPTLAKKPAFLYGWFHNDIADNFTVDPKSMKIKYFIDWEDTKFDDFRLSLNASKRRWNEYKFFGLMDLVIEKYTDMYKKYSKQS